MVSSFPGKQNGSVVKAKVLQAQGSCCSAQSGQSQAFQLSGTFRKKGYMAQFGQIYPKIFIQTSAISNCDVNFVLFGLIPNWTFLDEIGHDYPKIAKTARNRRISLGTPKNGPGLIIKPGQKFISLNVVIPLPARVNDCNHTVNNGLRLPGNYWYKYWYGLDDRRL